MFSPDLPPSSHYVERQYWLHARGAQSPSVEKLCKKFGSSRYHFSMESEKHGMKPNEGGRTVKATLKINKVRSNNIVQWEVIKVLDKAINPWCRIQRCHSGSLLTGEKQKR